jgi:hypothetical protein
MKATVQDWQFMEATMRFAIEPCLLEVVRRYNTWRKHKIYQQDFWRQELDDFLMCLKPIHSYLGKSNYGGKIVLTLILLSQFLLLPRRIFATRARIHWAVKVSVVHIYKSTPPTTYIYIHFLWRNGCRSTTTILVCHYGYLLWGHLHIFFASS